ncbi:MAG: sensor histidine kinase, partial [Cyanobacteria bacterium P01_H01_bin.152]
MKTDVLRSHSPLRQLLYVEWLLLVMAVFVTLPLISIEPEPSIDWGKLCLIFVFGVIGLRLPQRHWHKVLYTLTELGLILLVASVGGELPMMMRLLPQLGLIVVIRSCQLFQTWGRVMVLGSIFAMQWFITFSYLDLPTKPELLERLSFPPTEWQINVLKTNAIVFFSMVMVFVAMLVNALLAAYRSRQELMVAHEKLRRYAAKIENQATLYERNRIAREIHDSLGHSLTAQTILLENALLFLHQDVDRAQSYMVNAKNSAYETLREVSRSVSALRTRPLQGKHLPTAIPELVSDMCTPADIVPECTIELPTPLPDEVNLALFRIVQEALTNTVKHSHATRVQIQLLTKRDRLHLQVLDNGQGFDPSQNTTGFGLRGMRERATNLGGSCQLWSA